MIAIHSCKSPGHLFQAAGKQQQEKPIKIVDDIAQNLEKATTFSRRIGDLPGEAREVARQMLGDSVRFLQELSIWMLTHYHEVLPRSGTSDKECWGLITHYARTVLNVLGTARSPSRGPFLEGTNVSPILRGTLPAHRVM
jgi:hypothetical protein